MIPVTVRREVARSVALTSAWRWRLPPSGACGRRVPHVEPELAAFGASAAPEKVGAGGPVPRRCGALAVHEHPVFHEHRSETQMLRYLRRLSDAMSPSTGR